MVLLLASTQEQARVVFGYCKAALEASPVLRKEVVDTTRSEIRLRNGITIAVHAGNYRSVRGRTLVGAVFDECGFWRSDESVAPDVETLHGGAAGAASPRAGCWSASRPATGARAFCLRSTATTTGSTAPTC